MYVCVYIYIYIYIYIPRGEPARPRLPPQRPRGPRPGPTRVLPHALAAGRGGPGGLPGVGGAERQVQPAGPVPPRGPGAGGRRGRRRGAAGRRGADPGLGRAAVGGAGGRAPQAHRRQASGALPKPRRGTSPSLMYGLIFPHVLLSRGRFLFTDGGSKRGFWVLMYGFYYHFNHLRFNNFQSRIINDFHLHM